MLLLFIVIVIYIYHYRYQQQILYDKSIYCHKHHITSHRDFQPYFFNGKLMTSQGVVFLLHSPFDGSLLIYEHAFLLLGVP